VRRPEPLRHAAEVLAIPAFRRLWVSAYLCCVGDWLSLLGLSSLLAALSAGTLWRDFALSGVVITQLLPGLLLAPLAGVLADRFDRRRIMIAADLVRCGLFLSIAAVGTTEWLLAANFLVGCCSMMWVPAKDSSVPALLGRPEQMEAAGQLTLVTTYGLALLTGAGLFSLVSVSLPGSGGGLGLTVTIVVINGLLYLGSAILLSIRVPEIARGLRPRKPARRTVTKSGVRHVSRARLVRGLLAGAAGASAGAGTMIAVARSYAESLHGGEAMFGMLAIAVFAGVAAGVGLTPRLARLSPHTRLFGAAIILTGVLLAVTALAGPPWLALTAVGVAGTCAGVALLTGLTVVGSQVEDAIRGRVNGLLQAVVKVVLFTVTTSAPVLVAFAGVRTALTAAGVLAVLAGTLSCQLMGDRHDDEVKRTVEATL